MKKIIALIIFSLAMCNLAFSQSPLAELNKVKSIKLLESTRDDAIKILADDSLNFIESSDFHFLDFSMMNANVRIYYASGNCSEKSEDWNIPEYIVTEIEVSPKDSIEIKNAATGLFKGIEIDYSKLRKERRYGKTKGRYVYHDKFSGIAVTTRNDVIETISFSPSKKDYSRLCGTEEVRKYYSSKKWNRYPEMKKAIIDYNEWANVVNLTLDKTEITAHCDSPDTPQSKSCSDGVKKISVSTVAVDPENDVLTYFYKVSGGKIIGQGANVVWDLTGVKAGTYTITAGADDSCGICGKYITKTIMVRECPDCSVK